MKQFTRILFLLILFLCFLPQWSTVFAADACPSSPTSGVTYTVTTDCAFGPQMPGVDAGTGTANTAVLDVTSGSLVTIDREIGTGSLRTTSGTVFLATNGLITFGKPLYWTDGDGDTYGVDPESTAVNFVGGAGKKRRSALASTTTYDCNDNDPATYASAVCYPDADQDAYTSSAGAQSICDTSTSCNGTTWKAAASATVDANDNQACPLNANPTGTCNRCVNGAIAFVASGSDTFSECTGAYSCSGYATVGRNLCDGAGSCALIDAAASDCSGTCGSYCSNGSCISTDTAAGTCTQATDVRVANGGDGHCASSDCVADCTGVTATGGTMYYDGTHMIHTFTGSGTYSVTTGGNVEVLVVAGGGGASKGGGGAGGLVYNASFAVSPGDIPVTVGNGGATNGLSGGQNSVFSSITAYGGGIGAAGGTNGGNGGCGGGAGGTGLGEYVYGGTGSQGYAGGNSHSNNNDTNGGGGGGMGAAGGGSGAGGAGGSGGNGLDYSSAFGTGVGEAGYFSGGGGGYNPGDVGGLGGLGGGADGAPWGTHNDGMGNTGGGGGGAWQYPGGMGGSGIVIVKEHICYTPNPYVAATGGTVTTSGNYKIHTFLGSGTFTVTQGGNIEVLVVAGGGKAGTDCGGGGGGGGVVYNSAYAVTATSYTVTIGNGGTTANGENSVFDTMTAVGGGKGGNSDTNGSSGGSGGGAGGWATKTGGAATQGNSGGGNGYGYAGGNRSGVGCTGAGGGGAGEAGQGQGGDGYSSAISGTLTWYGAGGGGGGWKGNGGNGGGGGGNTSRNEEGRGGGPGTANTGGGGGGGSDCGGDGGNGGSGIVIIKYQYQ